MQRQGGSSSCSVETNTRVVDQSGNSPFFKFPLEVRLGIYSFLLNDKILHVKAVHPYKVNEQGIMVCPQLEEIGDDLLEGRDYEVKPTGDVLLKFHPEPTKPIGRFVEIEHDATWSRLFTLSRCVSTKSFDSASACPPGYCDHVDCDKVTAEPTRAIRQTCRQAYNESASIANDAKLHTALQFSGLQDLQAFSMLLNADQREEIRHIRVDIGGVHYSLPTWHYFCNVFATPWDRRSIKYLFSDDSDYPNHKAKISFYYNYSPHNLSGDTARALASSWVVPNVHLEWKFLNSSWGTVIDLWELRARSPLSVRFAMPQFLVRTEDGELDILEKTMWDDVTQKVLHPGDDGFVRLAERDLIETDEINDLLVEKREIIGSVGAEEKERFQKSYDTKFHYYWHDPHFDRSNWGPSWLRPLRQCQHFESFDIDFYDEEGPRTSMGLDILRDGLKERFTSVDIGPHPFLLYTC